MKTPVQEAREARYRQIYEDYTAIMSENKKRPKTPVYEYLAEKYGYKSYSGIPGIIKRAEECLGIRKKRKKRLNHS